LYHFRTPRTRDWGKYLKKLQQHFESNESTAHLSAYLVKAQEKRAVLVKLLDECAKEGTRPDDIMRMLDDYLPSLEQLIEAVEANKVKLTGYLDVVWTSFLTADVNGKSLSNTLKWEKISCYTLLGLAHYQKAVSLHHLNRHESHKMKQKASKEQDDEFDPIFDEPVDVSSAKPQIFDDKERVKAISQSLKMAASIWRFVASLFPCLMVESGKKALGIIPETFDCVLAVLADVALVNAQEFMIQLAVQTNKSPALTAKLSAGVSTKLKQCHKTLATSLSKEVFNAMKRDFVLYLAIRSDLYQAISLKYLGKLMKNEEKHGETVSCYQGALNILKHAAGKFPADNDQKKKKSKMTSHSIVVMTKSINKQKQAVRTLFDAAKSENDSVYFEVVPKPNEIEPPEAKFVQKAAEYEPKWQDL